MPQIEALSAHYRTYALDHVFDYGRSLYTRPMKKPDDFVQWLAGFFTALALDSINLMGFSYGAWQASLYALSFPQRLSKLILLAPASTVLPGRLEVVVRAMLYYFIPTHSVTKRYLYWFNSDSIRRDETTRQVIDNMVTELLLSRRCFKPMKFVVMTWQSCNENGSTTSSCNHGSSWVIRSATPFWSVITRIIWGIA